MPAEFGKRMLDRLGFTVPEMISAAKRMYVPCMYVCSLRSSQQPLRSKWLSIAEMTEARLPLSRF